MGLAGALVGAADGGDGQRATGHAYDDDAVVVLSEIDPALNAAPAILRHAQLPPALPAHQRQALPGDRPDRTDQGHRVLLRYVNVGPQTHAMGLLGGDQTEVADDGHPLRYPESAVTLAVQPGATVDTITTMPTGPEAKVALYEPGATWTTTASPTADPLSIAFGGMLTFLDTRHRHRHRRRGTGVDARRPVPQPLRRPSPGHRHG